MAYVDVAYERTDGTVTADTWTCCICGTIVHEWRYKKGVEMIVKPRIEPRAPRQGSLF